MADYDKIPVAVVGTSREAMLIREIEDGHTSDDFMEVNQGNGPKNFRYKAAAMTCGLLMLGAVIFFFSDPCRSPMKLFSSSDIELVEEKQLEAASRHLKSITSRADADKMVAQAMAKAKQERIEHHKLHKLEGMPPAMRKMLGTTGHLGDFFQAEKLAGQARKAEVEDIKWTAKQKAEYWGGSKVQQARDFRKAFCVFNVQETVDSLGGTGVDIDGVVRTCPEPRNDISEFACSVNAETLAEMVGTAATWLSSAVSSCDTFPNVGAECGAGVAGIVGALGEMAASATLAMTSCKEFPMAGFKADAYGDAYGDARVNSLGEPGIRMSRVGNSGPDRRLFIGTGIGGMGVQCGVDVGFIADNIYDTIFYIQQAVQLDTCSKRTRYGPYNYLTGVPEAACVLDIAGAIAWISQIATFVQQLVSHCPDLLELPTLCGSSSSGLFSSAAQIASWGSQVAIACGASESVTVIDRVIVFAEDYSVVAGREVAFVKLCSAAMKVFDVECTWVSSTTSDLSAVPGTHVPQVTMVGPYEGLLLAEAEIKDNGLKLPGFDQLTYLDTVRRPHGTGVRRLGRVADEDIIDKAVEEADKKWDPENHPSMKNLHRALDSLYAWGRNITGAPAGNSRRALTRANLKERLHLIEPALQEYSSKWSVENLDTCA